MENKISLDIASDTLQSVKASIASIKQNLPFLLSLTPDDRQSMPKMGDKTFAFVKKSYEYATQNPELVPSYVDIEEMRKDVETVEKLQSVYMLLNELHSKLDDTMMIAGSEAYVASLSFYGAVKEAAKKNVGAAKPIVEDLSARFVKGRSKVETAAKAQ